MAQKGYRFVNHTADVEFIAQGRTIEQAFRNALLALFELAAYTEKISKTKSKASSFKIADKAKDLETLAWYALQDSLTLSAANQILFYKVSGLRVTKGKGGYSIVAQVKGKKEEPDAVRFDLKGISAYALKVARSDGLYRLRVVVDV